MYIPKYFEIHELVPPQVFHERGELAWELMDDRLLEQLDMLRTRYGSMTINNWYWGGPREWSGLRTPDSPFYGKYSQHTFGRAADCLFHKFTAEEVRKDLLADPQDISFNFITSVELGTSWLHIDVRNCKRIKTYKP